jgi:hypothetical protein
MKAIKMTALALLVLFMVTGVSAQSETKEQLTVPLSDPGKPYKLDVGLVNGSIKVVGYEGKDILIDVQSGSEKPRKNKEGVNVNVNGNKDHGSTTGMKRINSNSGLDVSAEEKNNKVTVHSDSWKGAITLIIKVPQNASSIKLRTVNDGDISVSNVSGELEISNVNGAIRLTDISGSAVANTVNGNVVVNFKNIDSKAAMAFTSLNGNVDVTFPAGLKANLKLKSDMGEMFTDFDIEADKSQPKVNKTNQAGMYRLNIENWVYGKIGGGGPEMMMKNMNGNIYIRKTK